ncbi:MBL fold metallo-hydrolase [Alteromonas sp. a30]|uniref:MBL fold metallo-hydrolase n=1 Tax=Alteromonas sp. a30 TaxID=2730917 RepID=UPI003FA3A078
MKRVATALFALMASQTLLAQNFDDVQIKSEKINDSVYMLTGMGGNIGVSAGDDGILIIDDQFAPLAEKISSSLEGIAGKKLRYVINTHYHGDHTGGNAKIKHMHDATVFAHDNVRVRLENDPKKEAADLPVVTYAKGVKFHFNGETIHVRHLPHAHTDGDSYVYFEKANVIHTGDVMFNKMFPYIDLNGGGSVAGYIRAIEIILADVNDDTKVMPGHGVVATKQDVENFLNMLKETRRIVLDKKAVGDSVESIIKQGLGEEWQSWAWQFISEEKWIRTLYDGR